MRCGAASANLPSVLALRADRGAQGGVALREAPEPEPSRSQALVEVQAVSLNRGECRRLADMPDGASVGWDLAGVVRRAAADRSGPREGASVVGLVQTGAWAQLVAVETSWLAELPEGVSVGEAATLPVAGLTALLALDEIGCCIGLKVLVTGASGGVGRFAVQLAKIGGAEVTAVSASEKRAKGLLQLGADEVIYELSADGETFDGIVEGVGGESLGAALRRVAPGGTVVSFASSDPAPVQFPSRELFARAPGARLYGLFVFDELGRRRSCARDLSRLTALLDGGRLRCSVDYETSWRDAAGAIKALMARRIAGKAVLLLD